MKNKHNNDVSFRDRWTTYIQNLQVEICRALEQMDGQETFATEEWQRPEGGGGMTRVITGGNVFEKGGVNTSMVYGATTTTMREELKIQGTGWFACGLSLILHPVNPFVPTVHANWRYFELYDDDHRLIDCWFGGGMDLTPYYLFETDATHFHQVLKNTMDPFGTERYPRFKQQCDQYFNNRHRGFEMRGIGGVFYDHLRPEAALNREALFEFQQANGNAFLEAYLPIVLKRKDHPFAATHRYWQEVRRGRYVEFNLLHDRGTLFGLKTNGRIDSILISLPPTARFDYNYQPAQGSEEWKLLEACRHPKDWATLGS